MDKLKLETVEYIETAHKDILKNLTGIKNKIKKQLDRLQNGFTNEQRKGAEITAQKRKEEKEWFYQTIWRPNREKGIKEIKSILRRAEKEKMVFVKDKTYYFTISNNKKFSKSINTLQNWHTEFNNRNKDSC